MSERTSILADSSALIGLASCESEYCNLVFSEIGITTTYTCYKEIRDKAGNRDDYWQNEAASRIIDYIEDGEISYPTRINFPGAPSAGTYDAGEKSIRIAVNQYDDFSKVLLFDEGASVMLGRSRQELSGTTYVFDIEAPNFPLFVLANRSKSEERISDDDFCRQSETILQRMSWKNSQYKDVFWDYPIDC